VFSNVAGLGLLTMASTSACSRRMPSSMAGRKWIVRRGRRLRRVRLAGYRGQQQNPDEENDGGLSFHG
jgi:hypothetical protein